MSHHAPAANADQLKQFWARSSKARTGMLMVQNRHLPMSHYPDEEAQTFWFLSAKGSPMVEGADGSELAYIICDNDASIYADIRGHLTVEDNPAKVDELWSPIAASWYEDGREDPDLRLLKLSITTAEVWATDGTLKFLFETAKANATGEMPDVGDNFEIRYAA